MRFKTQIRNVSVLSKFCASLASLDALALCRLTDEDVQFTVIPDKGSQMWSNLKIDTVFENYIIQSAAERNTINLEVPIQALHRALKSALGATSVQLRLTKKDNVPMLSLTIVSSKITGGNGVVGPGSTARISDEYGDFDLTEDIEGFGDGSVVSARERETVITQDVPVKVLAQQTVAHLHEPATPPSDVNIFLPSLAQVKSVSERFTKLALATARNSSSTPSPRLELSANMHGSFKIAITTDALSISSKWTGLTHPELEPSMFENGSQGVRDDPSTKKKELGGPDGEDPAGWTTLRIDGKDFNRVLSVGRLNSRVIATFIPDHGLVLYVYLPNDDNPAEESVLTLFQRMIHSTADLSRKPVSHLGSISISVYRARETICSIDPGGEIPDPIKAMPEKTLKRERKDFREADDGFDLGEIAPPVRNRSAPNEIDDDE